MVSKRNLSSIPFKPGIYQFKDARGDILYIGKALNLKSRVASYFQKSTSLTPQKQLMIPKIKKIEFIITSSETEALLLESNLIKKYQPPYNIDLKDDKNFLYIKITVNEAFPRVFTVRKVSADKAKYFGPSASSAAVRGTLRFLRKLFPHRNFQKDTSGQHLKNLLTRYPQLFGPTNAKEYRENIERIIKFLKGQFGDIIAELKHRMEQASSQKKYEQAADLRDKIGMLTKVAERQKIISPRRENQDIISLARDGESGAINLFNIRQGALINKQNFLLKNIADQDEPAIVQAFIEQYYPAATDIPKQIIVSVKLPDKLLLEKTFNLKIITAQKGIKRQYLVMGQENAEVYLSQQKSSWQQDQSRQTHALHQLSTILSLPAIPERIEIFDISNIQGTNPVGSMVVFTHAKPDKKWYRKFRIKTVTGANDPAMMAEALARRFGHARHTKTSWPKPDLIILDGGKGQLGAVQKKVKLRTPIIALAKKEEDIYLPGKKNPINLPDNSAALFLLQRMRDEAHRFAISFFRTTHQKTAQHSRLDDIPGLGPQTRKRLIRLFGSSLGIRQASERALAQAVGSTIARRIKEQL